MALPSQHVDYVADVGNQEDTGVQLSGYPMVVLEREHKVYAALALVLAVAAGIAILEPSDFLVLGGMAWGGWMPG